MTMRQHINGRGMKDVLYIWRDGKFVQITENKPVLPMNANFLIASHHGNLDWSGYLTFHELGLRMKSMEEEFNQLKRTYDNGFFVAYEDR